MLCTVYCMSKINDTEVGNAIDLGVAMPEYSLIE